MASSRIGPFFGTSDFRTFKFRHYTTSLPKSQPLYHEWLPTPFYLKSRPSAS
jgi:hypothetical protein